MLTNNENERKGKVIPFLPSHSYSAYQCHFTITKNFRLTDVIAAFFDGYYSEKQKSQKESKKYYGPFNIEHPENWE